MEAPVAAQSENLGVHFCRQFAVRLRGGHLGWARPFGGIFKCQYLVATVVSGGGRTDSELRRQCGADRTVLGRGLAFRCVARRFVRERGLGHYFLAPPKTTVARKTVRGQLADCDQSGGRLRVFVVGDLMTATTATQQKTLFVGTARICQQIAYVLDIQDYAFAEKLTKQNFDQYRDYQIYVCEFKRRSRGLVAREVRRAVASNIQYLGDICKKIDEEYFANRERHASDLPNVKFNSIHKTFKSRLKHFIKQHLRVVWYVAQRIKGTIEYRRIISGKYYTQHNQQKQIPKRHLGYLRCLKPSGLLLYVLSAPINEKIQCTRLESNLLLNEYGSIKGCCSAVVPFGNLTRDGELDEIYHSTYARIVKLSSLNRSYCLCDLNRWCKGYCTKEKSSQEKALATNNFPHLLVLSFDLSCNLCCKSCRVEQYVMNDLAHQQTTMFATKLLRSGYLDQAQKLVLAGMGEVFYSPNYRQLLTTDLKRQQIEIKSNGTLFNKDNWQLLEGKYTTIDVNISVDAATAETYQKLRGADFNQLMKNLKMLADLHRRKQIRKFGLNFVVQRDNFREMPAFVHLGKSLGVDFVQFQRLNNFGTFTRREFLDHCLIIDNHYLDYELWCVLQDPIFNDPIVDLKGLKRYIEAAERHYRQREEQAQK